MINWCVFWYIYYIKDLELLCNSTDFIIVLIIMKTLMIIKSLGSSIKLTRHYKSISSVNPLKMNSHSKLQVI